MAESRPACEEAVQPFSRKTRPWAVLPVKPTELHGRVGTEGVHGRDAYWERLYGRDAYWERLYGREGIPLAACSRERLSAGRGSPLGEAHR